MVTECPLYARPHPVSSGQGSEQNRKIPSVLMEHSYFLAEGEIANKQVNKYIYIVCQVVIQKMEKN